MAVLFCPPPIDATPWVKAFQRLMPNEDFRLWPDVGAMDDIEALWAFRIPQGLLSQMPSLRLIQSIGAGTDQLTSEAIPQHVKVARTVDAAMIDGMIEFVLARVLPFHRGLHEYDHFQKQARWARLPRVSARQRGIAVLGLGPIGTAVAQALARFGFNVFGWSRSPHQIDEVQCLHGGDGLAEALRGSQVVINLLPLNAGTVGILSRPLFSQMAKGSFVINVSRGAHCVTADLVEALDSGHLGGAALDAFDTEPLPPDDPLWKHPKIQITPHIASGSSADGAAGIFAQNLERLRAGLDLQFEVSP
jgi:glyoxylate/hydroxypyruvate reductase A